MSRRWYSISIRLFTMLTCFSCRLRCHLLENYPGILLTTKSLRWWWRRANQRQPLPRRANREPGWEIFLVLLTHAALHGPLSHNQEKSGAGWWQWWVQWLYWSPHGAIVHITIKTYTAHDYSCIWLLGRWKSKVIYLWWGGIGFLLLGC